MITIGRFLFLTLLVTTHVVVVAAQKNAYQPPPASTSTETDRVRDGLLGPVRRIRSEVAKVVVAEGKLVENGKRVLLEAAEYDLRGAKTTNQYFPVAGSQATGREVYKYDEKGNISEMTLVGADGSMVSKESYKYEYDSLGNWTKMTTSVAVVENGAITFEPVEVTYRTISYYLDSRVTNLLHPANNAASAAPKVAAVAVLTNPKTNVSTPQQTPVPAFTFTRRSAISVTGPSPSMLPDVRNASFTTDQKVALDNAPPPRAPRAPVSKGVLNGAALNLPSPVYPDSARRLRLDGVVEVEVVIDENGKVVSAKAISGPEVFRDAAMQAALRARFTPTKLSGEPVKVTGKIVYNFKMAR